MTKYYNDTMARDLLSRIETVDEIKTWVKKMKINDFDFPSYLIKVCQKEEYADQLLAGKIYMKSSGYFRELEDGYRGDPYDGRKPIDVKDEEIYLEADGERVYLNGVPWATVETMSVGFENDDKIPIFCCCMLDENLIQVTGETTFKIKKEYLDELSRFGDYVVFISPGELRQKLEQYVKCHKDIAFRMGKVEYTDIMTRYSSEEFENRSFEDDMKAFFTKDLSYQYQNEWRVVAYGNQHLMETDFWELEVGSFQYGLKMGISDLIHGEFHVEEEVEHECKC